VRQFALMFNWMIKKKYYINKNKHLKSLGLWALIGLMSLLLIVVLNLLTTILADLIIVPFVLGGSLLFSLIAFYRSIFLIKLPLIIIDNDCIQYFNVLWYNKHRWNKFEIAFYNEDQLTLSIGLTNGRIFDRFMFSSLATSDIDDIIETFKSNNKLINT
jgi:hypothetical protein